MKVLELFAGTRSIGKAFEEKGHQVFSVEWDKSFDKIDLYADIGTLTTNEILQRFGKPDVIWASPDCATFSVAAISKHRRKNKETGNLDPISEYARFCDAVDQNVLKLIDELKPRFYFIENPRGGMRKMAWMQGRPRYTVTYCQYGERRMKPTDIWTNHPDPQFKPPCKNGDTCHDAAPRGSQTGTQALKNAKEKGIIPEALCQHIVDICEKYIKEERTTKMELRVTPPTFPEVISFNYEELKEEIVRKTSEYVNLVYTEDQIAEAKKDVALLRKFTKAMSDERIKIKKECLKPYEDFETKIKELDGIVNKAIDNIVAQVETASAKKKAEKLETIKGYFEAIIKPPWLRFEQIFVDKWLNSSVSLKTVADELLESVERIDTDLKTLSNLPEFGFEAVEVYKTTLDLNKAISEGKRLAEIQKRKAEEVARLERATIKPTPTVELPKEAPTEQPQKQWVSFKALLSNEDALALRDLFKARGIEYKPIESEVK